MREWPLNSAMLTTTTNSKLREAPDGTDTQVVTCAIDRWTAKMKRTEGYITREISRRGGRFGRRQEVLLVECQERRRRNHSRPRTEDKLGPFPPPHCWRSSHPKISPDCRRRPHKGPILKPAYLPNSLYWACWVWVCSHLQWKKPPKTGLYNYVILFCFSKTHYWNFYFLKIFVCIVRQYLFCWE